MPGNDPRRSWPTRAADPDDLVPVVRLLEGALLSVEVARVRRAIAADDVLVVAEDGRVRGALVLDGGHVVAVAVRPDWRRRGVGRALVEAASHRSARLTADFDPEVRGFYEALGFDVTERGDRLRGVRE